MATDRFITLAIHTYDRALTLRRLLESHGIKVKFENLVISESPIATGVRVKIEEHSLPLALRVVESGDPSHAVRIERRMEGESGNILIPVDFSPYSLLACRLGFSLARKFGLHPVLMHAYATPYFMGSMNYADGTDGNLTDTGSEVAEIEAGFDLRRESERLMNELKHKINIAIEKGDIPEVKFSTSLNEGVPEEVILEYCRLTPPALVVMATRGKDKKESDLVGSVTAEVLDSCRVPVMAVPENCNLESMDSIRHVAYFCNLDQHDIISVDTLMRMFDFPEAEITLIPVNDRAGSGAAEKVKSLCDYFNKNYPTAKFKSEIIPTKSFREHFEEYSVRTGIDFLIVPNKKKNIFSRLFNPGIAHKMLFERDLPLLALPV
nr:universal stress protein [uncultured Muribaculaceae bacterium]